MNQPKKTYRAVIFDMDGLLLDTEQMAWKSWKLACRDFGIDMRDEIFVQLLGRNVKDDEQILKAAYGPDFPFREVYDRRLQYMWQLVEQNGIPLKEGVREVLDYLVATQTPRAVATSTSRERALQKMALTGIRDYFPVVVAGDEIPRGKPHPDIFLVTAEKLGTAPEHCIVLEDSEAGIQAAHAAGMLPILVPDLKPPSEEVKRLAYRVCSSLKEVRLLLPELLNHRPGEVPGP